MVRTLLKYSRVLEIVGDTLKVHVPEGAGSGAVVRFGDLAVVESVDGASSLGRRRDQLYVD
ncbi:MAG: hypothetical protein AAF245_07215 [Pseudomonadota bacterium]